ncbi:uncharacterized protein [Manis javanica]|uniref:uncharacterized protein isoform X2 n=1 Tax=Manis javanica TaxID=9974 RepID=UPI003C6D47D1
MASLRGAVEMVKDVTVAREEAAREAAAQERRLPGVLGQVKDVVVPSAPGMEEWRACGAGGISSSSAESWWRAQKKIKIWQLRIPPGEVQPPPQVVEHSMLCSHPQAQALEAQMEIAVCYLKQEFKVPREGHENPEWVDLINAGEDGKSNRILLEQWFWPLGTKQKPETKQHDQPVYLQDFLLERLEKSLSYSASVFLESDSDPVLHVPDHMASNLWLTQIPHVSRLLGGQDHVLTALYLPQCPAQPFAVPAL